MGITSKSPSGPAEKTEKAPARLETDRMFGTCDLDPSLTPLERLRKVQTLQPIHGTGEFVAIHDLLPLYAEADGRKCVTELRLSDFYCSRRGTLASWGATVIFDVATLASFSTISSTDPKHWFMPGPDDATWVAGMRLMNLAAVSRSLDITFVRPAFLGDRVVVETEMTTFSRTTAVVRAVMRVPDEEEGADAEGRGRGKVIAIAKHDVSSLARMAAAFAKL